MADAGDAAHEVSCVPVPSRYGVVCLVVVTVVDCGTAAIGCTVVVFSVVELILLPLAARSFLADQPMVAAAWMGLAVKTDGAAISSGAITEALIRATAAEKGISYEAGWIRFVTEATQPSYSRCSRSPLRFQCSGSPARGTPRAGFIHARDWRLLLPGLPWPE